MRCRMVKTLLPLYTAGALRPEVAEQVDKHLTTCAACRMILHELRANQPEAMPPETASAPPLTSHLSQPLEAYRQNAALTKARDEVASAVARGKAASDPPAVKQTVSAAAARSPMPLERERRPAAKEPRPATGGRSTEHPGSARRGLWPSAPSLRSPLAVAQTLFTVVMVIAALLLGMAWRGSSLRLEAHQLEVRASAVAELQSGLRLITQQLQSPTSSLSLPPLSKETLAMSLLLKTDTLHQESYLPLIEAHEQMQNAIALWRAEQGTAPASITTGFATEASRAVNEAIQALEPLKTSWPPSDEQRAAVKQSATRLQGLALSYIDEGIVPGQFPEAAVSQQAAIDAAAALLPTGAKPIDPAAVRRYQRRQGMDLWEISFTHNLEKWQVQVSATSGQILGMTLPVPLKGDAISLEQGEKTARSYLADRTEADRFVLVGREEKDGQVVFSLQRVVAGLRYFNDPMEVGVARYGGKITYYRRLRPSTPWPDVPIYQLTAEQAKQQAAAWATAQGIAAPSDDGSLGVALHPSQQERLVWGFATSDPKLTLYVDAQTGEVWR